MIEFNFVPQSFEMNPETDDLLFDGHALRERMVVLIEENVFRFDPQPGEFYERHLIHAKKMNRWCTVSNLKTSNNMVYFIGIYEDGTKQKHAHPDICAWFVKKDSIPIELDPELVQYFKDNPPIRISEEQIAEANKKIEELKELGYFGDPLIVPLFPTPSKNDLLSAQGYAEHESGWWSHGSHWVKGDNATTNHPPLPTRPKPPVGPGVADAAIPKDRTEENPYVGDIDAVEKAAVIDDLDSSELCD